MSAVSHEEAEIAQAVAKSSAGKSGVEGSVEHPFMLNQPRPTSATGSARPGLGRSSSLPVGASPPPTRSTNLFFTWTSE